MATYRNSQQQKIALFNKFIKELSECFINKTQFPQNKKHQLKFPFYKKKKKSQIDN